MSTKTNREVPKQTEKELATEQYNKAIQDFAGKFDALAGKDATKDEYDKVWAFRRAFELDYLKAMYGSEPVRQCVIARHEKRKDPSDNAGVAQKGLKGIRKAKEGHYMDGMVYKGEINDAGLEGFHDHRLDSLTREAKTDQINRLILGLEHDAEHPQSVGDVLIYSYGKTIQEFSKQFFGDASEPKREFGEHLFCWLMPGGNLYRSPYTVCLDKNSKPRVKLANTHKPGKWKWKQLFTLPAAIAVAAGFYSMGLASTIAKLLLGVLLPTSPIPIILTIVVGIIALLGTTTLFKARWQVSLATSAVLVGVLTSLALFFSVGATAITIFPALLSVGVSALTFALFLVFKPRYMATAGKPKEILLAVLLVIGAGLVFYVSGLATLLTAAIPTIALAPVWLPAVLVASTGLLVLLGTLAVFLPLFRTHSTPLVASQGNFSSMTKSLHQKREALKNLVDTINQSRKEKGKSLDNPEKQSLKDKFLTLKNEQSALLDSVIKLGLSPNKRQDNTFSDGYWEKSVKEAVQEYPELSEIFGEDYLKYENVAKRKRQNSSSVGLEQKTLHAEHKNEITNFVDITSALGGAKEIEYRLTPSILDPNEGRLKDEEEEGLLFLYAFDNTLKIVPSRSNIPTKVLQIKDNELNNCIVAKLKNGEQLNMDERAAVRAAASQLNYSFYESSESDKLFYSAYHLTPCSEVPDMNEEVKNEKKGYLFLYVKENKLEIIPSGGKTPIVVIGDYTEIIQKLEQGKELNKSDRDIISAFSAKVGYPLSTDVGLDMLSYLEKPLEIKEYPAYEYRPTTKEAALQAPFQKSSVFFPETAPVAEFAPGFILKEHFEYSSMKVGKS